MSEWYDRAFGRWYTLLYPHRDTHEADRFWSYLSHTLPSSGRLLDVGCGTGRHMQVLKRRGRKVFGIDRSATLLEQASQACPGVLARADMRQLPFARGVFDMLMSLFTSFGYFYDERTHTELLQEYARVTRRGGRFLLDYLNADSLPNNLEAMSRRALGGDIAVEERRRMESVCGVERVIKNIAFYREGELIEEYSESVAVFSPATVFRMLSETGWEVTQTFGDYEGGPFQSSSPRLIVVSELQ